MISSSFLILVPLCIASWPVFLNLASPFIIFLVESIGYSYLKYQQLVQVKFRPFVFNLAAQKRKEKKAALLFLTGLLSLS